MPKNEILLYELAEIEALRDLRKQLVVQWKKWGLQRHTYQEWKAILEEELAEFNCQVIVEKEDGYEELKHCTAVCAAWMIDIILTRIQLGKELENKKR